MEVEIFLKILEVQVGKKENKIDDTTKRGGGGEGNSRW